MNRTLVKLEKDGPMSNRISKQDGTMSHRNSRIALVVLAAASCVGTRPARNAVLNENQYVRKDFLVAPADNNTPDPGWWLMGTVTSISTPNPLGDAFALSPGNSSGAVPIRFVVTEDKLQMVSTREEAATDAASQEVNAAVVNAWPAQNVDLMYYVNLDGELTNQYVVNQEAPWQQREWVQVNFDKNDMSDLAPLGEYTWNTLSHCVDTGDVSTTLVPNTFVVDEANNYITWTVAVTLPLIWDDATCVSMYGDLGQEAAALSKESVTLNLTYSLMRALPMNQVTYQPLVVAEKDGIQHKYGFLFNDTQNLDPTTGLLASQRQVTRFDPTKPIVWYFAQGFNPAYKHYFTDPTTGIVDRTNAVLAASGAAARIAVKEFDDPDGLPAGEGPRLYGDIRYNFLVWMADQFSQNFFAGATIQNTDYRTGEVFSATIAFNEFAFQDFYVQRINDYLLSIGAADDVNAPGEWPTTPSIQDATFATNCSSTPSTNSCPLTLQNSDGTTSTLNCLAGSTLPIQSVVQAAVANGTSTVFGKMQTYLGLPTANYGNLGPSDFIAPASQSSDPDFFNAYYLLLPYITYADPAMNAYTVPEGGNGTFAPPSSDPWTLAQGEVAFQAAAANLNAGSGNGWPYQGVSGAPTVVEAATGASNFRALVQGHHDYKYYQTMARLKQGIEMDTVDSLAFENVADGVARACSLDTPGQWQTKEQWVNDMTQAYWGQVEFHEFGHAMGLQHNFMGSVDAPHYPAYPIGTATQAQCTANPLSAGCVATIHSSSVMEYQMEVDRLTFVVPDWGPYDKGAIAWIYANTTPNGPACDPTSTGTACSISGQLSATAPWADPMGFDSSGNEMKFLFCDEYHEKYTPLCRTGDMGRSPSEIVANEISAYEWQYQWRNLRSYHKYWDDSTYANGPEALFSDLQKFVSLWAFDWSSSELAVTLHRIGITNPNPSGQSNDDYFTQLTNKFDAEMAAANSMAAAYSVAMINQAQDERPAATTYDAFYGDVTQQGIILDKYFAMQDFVGLWPVLNYDPTQAAGAYLAWYEGIGDDAFNSLTQWAVTTTLGGVVNVFPYFQPTSVALFAQDTHDPAFGNPPIRNWIGGWEFYREQDFVQFFLDLAVKAQYSGPTGCVDANANPIACACTTYQTCTYDPRNVIDPNSLNQLVGPDGKRYVWAYIQDRNQYVVAQQDINIITNTIILNYTSDVIAGQDDGNFPGLAYTYELPIKYTADSFTQFN
jgi:hypothetical protein